MAKIILGKRPKNFKRTVTFEMPGEGAGSIEVNFKYRTRTEFAAFQDEIQAAVKAEGEKEIARLTEAAKNSEQVPDLTQSDIIARQNEFNVNYLMGAVEGWNLDVPFDRESAAQLADELPAAVIAIMSDYRAAVMDGRLGN